MLFCGKNRAKRGEDHNTSPTTILHARRDGTHSGVDYPPNLQSLRVPDNKGYIKANTADAKEALGKLEVASSCLGRAQEAASAPLARVN